MRLPAGALLLAVVAFGAVAEGAATVNSVVSTVRASLHKKNKDAETAEGLGGVKLSERLEDRVIEILESEGAGPQTLGALQRLRDDSRSLPVPANPPPGMTPPAPPSALEEHQVWQETRRKALDYTHSLPNFICSETIHRWMAPKNSEQWQASPTVLADLSFFEGREHYKVVTVDGRPTEKTLEEVGGTVSQGEFGSLLSGIFSPASETDYRWDHWTILRQRPTAVFFYRISAAHHPHHLRFTIAGGETYRAEPGQRGYVYIDRETNTVTRIAEEAEDIPGGFPVVKSSAVVDYGQVDVGGKRFLLPLRAEVRLDTHELSSLNSVEFQKYRKFAADTSLSFDSIKK